MSNMPKEFRELAIRMGQIKRPNEVAKLYHWLWRRNKRDRWWKNLNGPLKLEGDGKIKNNLPCVAVGSLTDLVVVGANPGFQKKDNFLEEEECRRSSKIYSDFMQNFFDSYPRIVRYSSWWTSTMPFLRLLNSRQYDPSWEIKPTQQQKEERWKIVHERRDLGGWDLFPFHSTEDHLTAKIFHPRFATALEFALESFKCLRRLKPRIILVASKQAYVMARILIPGHKWRETVLNEYPIAWAQDSDESEIVAIGCQFFARNVPKKPLASEVIRAIESLRIGNHNKRRKS